MKVITPYHFAPARAEGFAGFYQQVRRADGYVCFDLEDSVQGSDEASTLALKAARRRAIAHLCQSAPAGAPYAIGLRLNPPDSPHYAPDLALLRELPPLHCVFLPKVEEPAALQRVLRELPDAVPSVIPVIESVAGFANLAALLAVAHPAFTALAFGHCDYNLSAGHFPFHHQNSPLYWSWIRTLDAQAQQASKQLLKSPVLQLADDAAFAAMLTQARTFASLTGQITLCLAHTQLCASLLPVAAPAAAVAGGPGGPAEAARVVQQYEQHPVAAAAFALDPRREVISPHEYAAARRVLASSPCTY